MIQPPATGAQDIVVTMGGTATRINVMAICLTGAKQSAQPDNSTTATGTGTSVDTALTPVADNCWLSASLVTRTPNGATPDETSRIEQNGADDNSYGHVSTTGPVTPAASTNMGWATSQAKDFVHIVVSWAPAVAAPGGQPAIKRGWGTPGMVGYSLGAN